MFTQKEAVFETVCKFYGQKFKNGMDHSKDDKSKIVDALIESFEKGKWEIKSEQENLRTYVIGLLNNHLRKDTRMNGGDKYTAKNPGSRAGQGDPEIKEARKLLKTFEEGSDQYNKIQSVITAKVEAAKAEKQKTSIDVEALPAELRELVG